MRLYHSHFRARRVKFEIIQLVAARAETKLQSSGWVAQLRRPGSLEVKNRRPCSRLDLPCSRARHGSLRRSAAAPAARARGDAGTLRAARHPPGVAQRQHGTAASGRVHVLAQATGLVPRSLSPPALPSSRPRPRPGGAPGGTLSPGTERATRWRPPIAPCLHRDVSNLGGYL